MRGVRLPCLVVLLNEFESVVDVKSQRFGTDPICALEQNSQNSLGIAHLFQAAGHVNPGWTRTHDSMAMRSLFLNREREREIQTETNSSTLCCQETARSETPWKKKNQTNSCLVKKLLEQGCES